jgi:hypothetical protein
MVFISVMLLRTLKPQRWRLTLLLGCVALAILNFGEIMIKDMFPDGRDAENRQHIAAIEHRLPNDGSTILAQYPAVSILHRSIGERLMTTHFINFPVDSRSVIEVLRENNVGTMVLYRTQRAADYSFEVAPLWDVAKQYGHIDTVFTGFFFDVALDKWHGYEQDSLYLVSLKQ